MHLRSLIEMILAEQPGAKVGDVIRELGGKGVQVSGIVVSTWMQKWQQQRGVGK